mmetsp:Transcript_15738/g.36386  ORF Transcript_15738/g.36386 Transcript_15738/m.36386 type:complete len:463 (+) Transcript_15738:764-2152(+)
MLVRFDQKHADASAHLDAATAPQQQDEVVQDPLDVPQRKDEQALLQLGLPDGFQDPQEVRRGIHPEKQRIGGLLLPGVLPSENRRLLLLLIGALQSLHDAISRGDAEDASLHGRLALGLVAAAVLIVVVFLASLPQEPARGVFLSADVVEHPLQLSLPLFLQEDDVLGALPDSNLPIQPAGHHERSGSADREAADLREVTVQHQYHLEPIGVPVPDGPVLARREEVVRPSDEAQIGHGILVTVKRPVGVSEVKTPDLDRLVGSRRRQEKVVVAGVDRQGGKLVPVQAQEELERVVEEDLDGGIQAGDEDHPFRRVRVPVRVPNGDDVVRHLEGSRVNEHRSRAVILRLEIPELDGLVGGSRDEGDGGLLGGRSAHVDAPDRSVVRILFDVRDVTGRDVEDQQVTLPGAEDQVGVAGKEHRAETVQRRAVHGRDHRLYAGSLPDVPYLRRVLRHRASESVVGR